MRQFLRSRSDQTIEVFDLSCLALLWPWGKRSAPLQPFPEVPQPVPRVVLDERGRDQTDEDPALEADEGFNSRVDDPADYRGDDRGGD